jgi:hypothetical protein
MRINKHTQIGIHFLAFVNRETSMVRLQFFKFHIVVLP